MVMCYRILHEPPMWPLFIHQYVVFVPGMLKEFGRFDSELEAREFIRQLESDDQS